MGLCCPLGGMCRVCGCSVLSGGCCALDRRGWLWVYLLGGCVLTTLLTSFFFFFLSDDFVVEDDAFVSDSWLFLCLLAMVGCLLLCGSPSSRVQHLTQK